MARHTLGEPRVSRLIDRLIELVLFEGSVNAAHRTLVAELERLGGQTQVYPNRLHALLSMNQAIGVNTGTVELLERALTGLALPPIGGARDRLRAEILHTHDAASVEGAPEASTLVRLVAQRAEVPPAIANFVLEESGLLRDAGENGLSQAPQSFAQKAADWSFQNEAVEACLRSLEKGPNRKVGLVVPTGGGKTRIAMRIALRALAASGRAETVVLWVTHRHQLRRQAKRELQRALATGGIEAPSEAAMLLEDRVTFVMIGGVKEAIQEYGDRVTLIVVDEGHHAAAPSYNPLFDIKPLRGLFLTATPNRADKLPLGIDEIAYTITYRELFARGVVVEPIFDDPINMDWSKPTDLSDLADYLLDRVELDLNKILVATSRIEYLDALFQALQVSLGEHQGHPLDADDIGYVHAGGTATPGAAPLDYLDEFVARPKGILVATSQLIGEGFDDPGVDAIVITYPSESIGHLMQVAGRALRSAPGKKSAHIIQVHTSPLEYHFEQRWLYQDISDSLRPRLVDLTYGNITDLQEKVRHILGEHNVSVAVSARIVQRLQEPLDEGPVSLLLTGLPYAGTRSDFTDNAEWGAILVTPEQRLRFVSVFNDFADRGADVTSHADFLSNYMTPDHARGSEWKSYMDMLAAMDFARKEIERVPYAGESRREYMSRQGTSWLKYLTFVFQPLVPSELGAFLADAVNRDALLSQYLAEPENWRLAVKVPLVLAGTVAFLLDASQSDWLARERALLLERLAQVTAIESFAELSRWRSDLPSSPLPGLIMERIEHLVAENRFSLHALPIPPIPPGGVGLNIKPYGIEVPTVVPALTD